MLLVHKPIFILRSTCYTGMNNPCLYVELINHPCLYVELRSPNNFNAQILHTMNCKVEGTLVLPPKLTIALLHYPVQGQRTELKYKHLYVLFVDLYLASLAS